MKLTWLQARDFRNHVHTHLDAGTRATILIGNNGEGKTNLVEAVSYVCLAKSFYADNDTLVLRRGAGSFLLEAEFLGDSGARFRVCVQFEAETGEKRITVNGVTAEKLSEHIGRFPIVVLSPEQAGITAGLPAERRRFLDLVISQSNRLYLEDLLDYRKVLRQRNKILADAKISRRDCTHELEPWNESMAALGGRIIHKRLEFIDEFRAQLVERYDRLAGGAEAPTVRYEPSVSADVNALPERIAAVIAEALHHKRADEQRIGTSLVGPHRDELRMEVGGLEARRFASQGQHKTLLIAMKLAELTFLKERSKEQPILILDDVLSELDRDRSSRLLGLLPEFGQTFVTTTTDSAFPKDFYHNTTNRRVEIRAGTIVNEA